MRGCREGVEKRWSRGVEDHNRRRTRFKALASRPVGRLLECLLRVQLLFVRYDHGARQANEHGANSCNISSRTLRACLRLNMQACLCAGPVQPAGLRPRVAKRATLSRPNCKLQRVSSHCRFESTFGAWGFKPQVALVATFF